VHRAISPPNPYSQELTRTQFNIFAVLEIGVRSQIGVRSIFASEIDLRPIVFARHALVRQPGDVQYWIIRYECQFMVAFNILNRWMDFACDDAAGRFDRSGKVTKSAFEAGVLSAAFLERLN
jgi:hypothetical protein